MNKKTDKKRKIYKLLGGTFSLILVALIGLAINYKSASRAQEAVQEITQASSEEVTQASSEEVTQASTKELIQASTEETILLSAKKTVQKPKQTEAKTQPIETAKAAMTQDQMEAAISEYNTGEIDFTGLQKINSDVYAWISISGTEIEYPILQSATDNTHYLNYNIDGSYGYPGCIYTENMNAKDFLDSNTVIYGHNMKNGTMFTGLHKFKDKSFFEKNTSITITTPNKTLSYKIFAAYPYDDRHLLYSFDFSDPVAYQSYLDSILNQRDMSANINSSAGVTKDSKIITLVTCIGSQPEKRWIVQAVLQ